MSANAGSKGKTKGSKCSPPPPPSAVATADARTGKTGGYLARAAERKKLQEATDRSSSQEVSDVALDPWLDARSPCPRFDLSDAAAMLHLEEHGYVVIRSVADAVELQTAESLLFDFMRENAGWHREDSSSWTDESLNRVSADGLANGIINKRGAGHSDLSWYVRTLPRVREVFAHVWGTSELLTSYDAFGLFRPWHSGKFMKTLGGWLHADQCSPGRQCIQGLLSLYDQDHTTGGFTVIPGSHRRFDEVSAQHTTAEEYIRLTEESPVWQAPHRIVHMRAGDFVLWDSRCVHCNSPAVEMPSTPVDRLLRAVVYVCMTPKAMASPEIIDQRINYYNMSKTTSHWPHKMFWCAGFKREPPLDYESASEERRALIVGSA